MKSNVLSSNVFFQVLVACLSLFALGWMDNARGPFFPLFLEATGVSSTQGSLFFATASFVAIASSASAGWIAKVMGLRFLVFLGGAAMFLSPFGLCFSPNLTGSLVTAFVFGSSLGWLAVGQNALISAIEDESLKRRLFALLHCFYALAAMTAPLSVVFLKTLLPWNQILMCASFFSFLFLILLPFLKIKNAKVSLGVENLIAPKAFSFSSIFWVLFMSFYVGSELILSTRLVVLGQSFGLSFQKASSLLFYFFLGMFFTRLFFFFFKFQIRAILVLSTAILGALLSFVLGYMLSPYFLTLIGAFIGPVFPVVMECISKKWPQYFDVMVSRVIALSSLFVVSSHIFVGRVTDAVGVQKALYIVPTFLSLALAVLCFSFFSEKIKELLN